MPEKTLKKSSWAAAPRRLRFGTRDTELANIQCQEAEEYLRRSQTAYEPQEQIKRITVSTATEGLIPLTHQGQKGIFTSQLDQALLKGQVDVAVHSLKDMPSALHDDICIAAVLPRADPRDICITRQPLSALSQLPSQARVGTSSPRRRALLLAARPDLRIVPIRGTIATRLRKLKDAEVDAIVLAAAGLDRLGLEPDYALHLETQDFLPAAGQGALALAARANDHDTLELLATLDHKPSRVRIEAERAVLYALGGSCLSPIAAFARMVGPQIHLHALLADPEGKTILRESAQAPLTQYRSCGQRVGDTLKTKGEELGIFHPVPLP